MGNDTGAAALRLGRMELDSINNLNLSMLLFSSVFLCVLPRMVKKNNWSENTVISLGYLWKAP